MAKQTATEYKNKVRANMAEIIDVMKKATTGELSEGLKMPQKDDEFTELREYLGSILDDLRQEKKTNGIDSSKRLSEITPVLQKVSLGDFSLRLPIPEGGDEFTPLLIAINLMIDDFSGMVQSMKKKSDELEKRTGELKEIKENLELEVEKRTRRLEKQVGKIKEVESKIKESEKKFRALVKDAVANFLVWELDTNGIYTYVSPATEWVYGYAPKEVIGKSPFDFMPPAEVKKISAEFSEIVKSKKAFVGLENSAQHKDGKTLIMLTSGSPIYNEEGQFSGYSGIAIDITGRKKTSKKLEARQVELEKMNKLMVGRELKMVELKKEIIDLKRDKDDF